MRKNNGNIRKSLFGKIKFSKPPKEILKDFRKDMKL